MSVNIGGRYITLGGLQIGRPQIALTGGGGGAAPCVPVDQIDGSVSQGATFEHPADGVIAWDIDTIPSAASGLVLVRKVDSNNCWRVTWGSTGSLFLIERVSGATTTRGAA